MRSQWATVRARTTLLASAVTGLTLVAGAVALVLTLQSQLTGTGDALARARVQDLLASAASGDLPRSLDNVHDDSVAQVIDDRGRVMASSDNITGRPPITRVEPSTQLRVLTVEGPDDDETERYRVWVDQGTSPTGRVTVLVGTSLESVTEATRTLREALIVGLPVLLLLLAVAIWTFVGRALHRIDRITAAVDGIGQSELDRRVPLPPVDDEVGRLAHTMNRMLDRLEGASSRQRAFVADASHDLQSPLAAQRAQLEVALAHPDRVEVTTLARELLENSTEMEQLVRDLLYLAVADDGRRQRAVVLLDLDDIVLEEAARVRQASGVRVDTSDVSAAPVLGEPAELRRLVRNILDNAVRHAVTRVDVRLFTQDIGVLLDVADDGPGVPPSDRERVFDRFYRGDASRSRRGGSGLGLAIALSVAQRHGGDLRLLDSGEGAHFQLRLSTPT